ncbi:MAG: hypothetical protein QOJ30_3068 [Pseudonocardiales bacterium]|nr:hypothetical protein [Pseudonocardiales bacterium]
MRARGPVLTLLAVLAVGVAVFAVNTVLNPTTSTIDAAAAPLAASAPADGASGYSDGYGEAAPAPAEPQAAPAAQAPAAQAPAAQAPAAQAPAAQAPAAAAPATRAPGRPAVADTAFAGRSAGNQVTLSVGVKDGQVLAYVCDGKDVEEWLTGTMEGSSLTLTGSDGTSMTAGTTEDSVLGNVSVGGKSWPFAAQAAKRQPADTTDRAALRELSNA